MLGTEDCVFLLCSADVDWARYNQQARNPTPCCPECRLCLADIGFQVLFVDRTDTIRARVAAGLFDIVSNWNGMDMVLVQDRCGTEAEASGYIDPSMAMTLVSLAQQAGMSPRCLLPPGCCQNRQR